jgi:hypothetical protein
MRNAGGVDLGNLLLLDVGCGLCLRARKGSLQAVHLLLERSNLPADRTTVKPCCASADKTTFFVLWTISKACW